MSIRVRLVLAMLLVGVVPVAIAVLGTTGYMQTLAIRSGRVAVEKIGKAAIYDQAQTTAQQIRSYLDRHPEVDLTDLAALEANQELASLAVQPVGKTGYTAVFDANAVTHFHANPQIVGMDMSTLADTLPAFWAILAASLDGTPAEGYYDWKDADGVIRPKFMAVVPVEGTPLRVAATTYMDEFAEPAEAVTGELQRVGALAVQRFAILIAIAGLVSLAAGIFFGVWFTTPLREMAQAAARVMEGQWETLRPLRRRDELGTLSRALVEMTGRLRDLVQGLEERVAERTRDLERRARYQAASTQVARDAASVLDQGELLQRVASLIGERFGFYHAGLFLLDESREWAVLEAASSEGGQRMLARGHRLKVGTEGMVGYVTASGKPRVALDVGADAAFFDNPDLPDARSEMTLPLLVRGQVIGALDVQSTEAEAFTDENIEVLQTLADQVAVAISNARLFRQAQQALEAERRARGELTLEAWQSLLRARPDLGFRSTEGGIAPAGYVGRPEMKEALRKGEVVVDGKDRARVAIPVRVEGQVIGVVEGRKPEGEWTEDERLLMRTLTEQLSAAVERARLYRETQRRAARERVIGEVTGRMRGTLDVDVVLQTAVREIGEALALHDVTIQLETETDR